MGVHLGFVGGKSAGVSGGGRMAGAKSQNTPNGPMPGRSAAAMAALTAA